MNQELRGKKLAFLVADGFEKIELVAPLKALKSTGAQIDIISLRSGRIRGMNVHEPAGKIKVDKVVNEVSESEYAGLFIPGGHISPDLLRQSGEARTFVKSFLESGKPVASICHGPWLIASSGEASDRILTSWPGIRDDLVNAGATWVNQAVVHDGNLLTSRGPDDLGEFIPSLIKFYAGELEESTEKFIASSPQVENPPEMIMKALKWIPRPSFRTAGIFAALSLIVAGVGLKKAV